MPRDAMADCESAAPEIRERCPQCDALEATLTLLTSMTKYFACLRCHHRWRVAIFEAVRSEKSPPVML